MKDKLQIMFSPLGMYSILRGDYIISILNNDGSLNRNRVETLLKYAANNGANALRDFSWIDSQYAWETISPFWVVDGKPLFNDTFFAQQRIIAETCQNYGIRYYHCLFDNCGTKGDTGKFNPWRFYGDYFYGNDASAARKSYIDRFLNGMEGIDFGIDICNEPRSGAGDFLAEVFLHLVERNFDFTRVILGNDYYLKEKNPDYGKDYRTFRDQVVEKLGDHWEVELKNLCLSPVHNATLERIKDLWGDDVKPGGLRRVLYSMDGVKPRPDSNQIYEIARKVLETKSIARNNDKVHFEVVLGKQDGDPLYSVSGVFRAYKEIFGENPSNYGRYLEAQPPGVWGGSGTPVVEPTLQQQIDDLSQRVSRLETSLNLG